MNTIAENITIILADDHRLVREGIRSLLSRHGDMRVIADVASTDALLSHLEMLSLRGELPTLVLLDISMPHPESLIKNGFEAASFIKEHFPSVQILFLSMHEEAEYIIAAMKTGALGYVLKNAEQDELVQAIQTVASGKRFLGNSLADKVFSSFAPSQSEHTAQTMSGNIPILTQRESQIVRLVAQGLSTKLIAEELIISPRTVETHRTNIMQKLKASNTAELVRIALQYGLVKG